MAEHQLNTGSPEADLHLESRAHERPSCELPASCREIVSWTVTEEKSCGVITNISLGGVRLRLPRAFEPDARLAIELSDEDNKQWVVFARVVHALAEGNGFWNLGCHFVNGLGEDELRRLLHASRQPASVSQHVPGSGQTPPVQPSQLAAGPDAGVYAPDQAVLVPKASDQRNHQRHQSLQSNVLRLAIRPSFGGRAALLVDVSAGGVGFLFDRPLGVEDVLVMEVSGPDGVGLSRLARVRRCHPCPIPADAPWLPPVPLATRLFRRFFGLPNPEPTGEAWMVGCQFTRPLAEEELKELFKVFRLG